MSSDAIATAWAVYAVPLALIGAEPVLAAHSGRLTALEAREG